MTIVQKLQNLQADNFLTTSATITGVTAGNTLVVAIAGYNGNNSGLPFATVTDDVETGVYHRDLWQKHSATYVHVYRRSHCAAGSHAITFSATATGTYINWVVYEVEGVISPFGSSTALNVLTTTPSSGSAFLHADSMQALVIGLLVSEAAPTSYTIESTSPAWTVDAEETAVGHSAGSVASKIVSSAGSYTAQWTAGASVNHTTGIIGYEGVPAGGGGGLSWAPLSVVAAAGGSLIRAIASGGISGRS